MKRRYNEAKDINKKFKNAYGGAGDDGGGAEEGTVAIDMQKRSSVLYTSDNYSFINLDLDSKEKEDPIAAKYETYLKNISYTADDRTAAPDLILTGVAVESTTKKKIQKVQSALQISDMLIQSPFVELTLGGYTIGSYKGSDDEYPNHIMRMEVDKINGEINRYTINLVHQIRAGEDPNILDKLFSKVRYNKIQIRYGDCASELTFKDVEAVITNVVDNRDYANSKITYTVYATSTCNYITGVQLDFPGITDKPSNVIQSLLYNKGEISQALVSVFPGMTDRNVVNSNNYIPSNDTVLHIDAQSNTTVLDYIKYLTGCMSNATNSLDSVLRNSTYYLTYEDDINGSYFRITERGSENNPLQRNVFSCTVGYPDGNDVLGFNVNNESAWQLLYKNGQVSSEFYYDVDSKGNVVEMPSKSLFNRSQAMNEIQKNWWTQMINFPISANLTLRGLLKPVNLMDYINLDVVFYGQRHITSGLYTIVGQIDTLDGSGFKTNLKLVRVSSKYS